MLTHRSGRFVASAILLIPMVEELLASTAPAGATRSSSAKIERLRSRSSKTASMTNSAHEVAAVRLGRLPQLLLACVGENGLEPMQRRLLCDLGAHRPCADDREA